MDGLAVDEEGLGKGQRVWGGADTCTTFVNDLCVVPHVKHGCDMNKNIWEPLASLICFNQREKV